MTLDLGLYEKHGISLLTRTDTYGDDRGVVDEVMTYDIGPDPVTTCVDIGAHIGAFSLYIAKLYPDAEIIAVEPDPDNVRVLKLNAEGKNIQVWQNPVGYYADTLDHPLVVVHPSHSTCNWVVPKSQVPQGYQTRHTGDYVTLEDILGQAEFDTLDLLKIDAEGAEVNLFENCATGTLQRIKRIVGEFHHGHDAFVDGIGKRLLGVGFNVVGEMDPNRHATFTAWKA